MESGSDDFGDGGFVGGWLLGWVGIFWVGQLE